MGQTLWVLGTIALAGNQQPTRARVETQPCRGSKDIEQTEVMLLKQRRRRRRRPPPPPQQQQGDHN